MFQSETKFWSILYWKKWKINHHEFLYDKAKIPTNALYISRLGKPSTYMMLVYVLSSVKLYWPLWEACHAFKIKITYTPLCPTNALIGLNQDKPLCPLCESCVLVSTRATGDTYSDTDLNNNACHGSDPMTPSRTSATRTKMTRCHHIMAYILVPTDIIDQWSADGVSWGHNHGHTKTPLSH